MALTMVTGAVKAVVVHHSTVSDACTANSAAPTGHRSVVVPHCR
jgi:hypothetical protein